MKNVPGNYYDKHHSKNPAVKYLMHNFHRVLIKLLNKISPKSVLDVGCGEGYTTKIIINKFPKATIVGCDIEKEMVDAAKKNNPKHKFYLGSAYDLKFKAKMFDVTIMNEVLEHLDEPERAILECERVAKKGCIFSVPNEPYWRMANVARFRYLSDFGNTPGHIQNFTRGQFRRMLKKHFRKVIVVNAYLWNFGLCWK